MSQPERAQSRSKRLSQRLSGALDTIFPLNNPSRFTGNSSVMATTDPDAMPPLPSGISPNLPPPVHIAAPALATKHPTCTHMTMTRLYTKEFRCAVCLHKSLFGWVYRCTQDRELLLENDVHRGLIEKFDGLGDIFERPTSPPKRGPAARHNPAAFLEELTEDQINSYSRDQLKKILAQRILILETAARETVELKSSAGSQHPTKPMRKPWMSLHGGECQFKCCHGCRPSSKERSFLSLNGIADGDLPLTAVTGFGFHLQGYRPVLNAGILKNLGLRDNPPRSNPPNSALQSFPSLSSALTSHNQSHFDLAALHKNTLTGLGRTSRDDIPRPPTPRFPPDLPIPSFSSVQKTAAIDNGSPYALPIQPNPESTHSTKKIVPTNFTKHVLPINRTGNFERPLPDKKSSSTLNLAVGTILPDETEEEMEAVRRPCSPMEMVEAETGWFGSKPLVVRDGVAVTEEGVEGHFADLRVDGPQSVITQF